VKVVIDTSSLLSLVRYYLPFDKKRILLGFFRQKIESAEIIIIDKVLDECSYSAKGVVISTLDFLTDKTFQNAYKIPYKTESLIAPSPAKFLRQVEHQFVMEVVRSQQGITNSEFEVLKNDFLNGADIKQVILCLNIKKTGERVILVTEETKVSNDNKLFKKLPAICKDLEIETMTLPELLSLYSDIDIDFQKPM
jgi:hypothetical protein